MILLILFLIWVASSLVCAGWIFADICAIWAPGISPHERHNLGTSLTLGMLAGFMGPFGVIFVWLISGFGHRGWRLKLTPTK